MEYSELLDLTLELEGLLLVKLRRGNSAPVETERLIAKKIARINALCPSSTESDDEAIAATVEMEEDEDALPSAEPGRVVADAAPVEPTVNDLTRAFTLNDKFRFRRELFHNSDADLNETLDVLQAMDSLDEAEDYLYNDLAWDPENTEVKAFIALIAPCWTK